MGTVPEAIGAVEIEPGIFAIQRMPKRSEIRDWSAGLPGMLWISQDHFSHSVGSKATYYVLADDLAAQLGHRERLQAHIGRACGPTWGSQARALLKSLEWKYDGYNSETMRRMLETPDGGDAWHYQKCEPRSAIPDCTLYDLKSAYWQIIKRMPSPIAVCSEGRTRFLPLHNPVSRRKWDTLAAFLDGGPKPFRLQFIGVCASGASAVQTHCYHNGAILAVPIRNVTALAGMAVLAIRVTHEVCQMQADAINTRYANVDCVLDETGGDMEVWEALGMEYSARARGLGDVRAVGCWKVGELSSGSYAKRPITRGDKWHKVHKSADVEPKYYKFLQPRASALDISTRK